MKPEPAGPDRAVQLWRRYTTLFYPGIACIAFLVSLLVLLPRAALILLTDGWIPGAVLLSAWGYGAIPASRFTGVSLRSAARGVLAVALGLGWLSIAALVLGCAGVLGGVSAWALISGGFLFAGLYALRPTALPAPYETEAGQTRASGRAVHGMLGIGYAALGVAAAVSIAGATLPPGLLWTEEAGGYDALEYHLQAPREYFEAGRIRFLPHNVYASFPQVAEMLFLLQMHMAGDVLAGAIPAQLLHAFAGVLVVIGAGVFSQRGAAAHLATLVAGSIQWIAYLGCLAYVENFMLLFAVAGIGVLLDGIRSGAAIQPRTICLAGLLAGFSGGCKYTALALVVAAPAFLLIWATPGRVAQRAAAAVLFLCAAGAAFAPWAIRNVAFTGNPVYPFAYGWFGGRAWSDEQSEQWARGHRLSSADQQIGRMRVVLREIVSPAAEPMLLFSRSRFGIVSLVLSLVGALCAFRRPETGFLVFWVVAMVAIWAGVTHMPGRFLVLLAAPLSWLAGMAAVEARRGLIPVAAAALGAWVCAGRLVDDLATHLRQFERRTGVSAALMPGQVSALREAHWFAQLPADAHVWVIGDAAILYAPRRCHYTVVFNRDPWLAECRRVSAAECLESLRREGVTHIAISWAEVERLRNTYGFDDAITREWAMELLNAGAHVIDEQPGSAGAPRAQLFQLSR